MNRSIPHALFALCCWSAANLAAAAAGDEPAAAPAPAMPAMAHTMTPAPASSAAASSKDQLKVSSLQYALPDVKLLRQSGKPISFPAEVNDGRPVVLNFIFTSCGAICPLMSQTLSRFQDLLGADSSQVHIMSISIDPEEDTPGVLRAYAAKFHAGAEWNFYTGTLEASIAAQKAFNMYRGDKMSHTAVTFMRSSPTASWRRIDGFATADDLLREYRAVLASR